jgi:hypothetical protein
MDTITETLMKNSKYPATHFIQRTCMAICAAALALVFAGSAQAQAPPGPISGAPDTSDPPARVSSRGGASANNKWKLAGDWKLNKNLSDDPRQRMEQATGSPRGSVGTNGPWGGMGGGGHRNPAPGVNSGRASKQFADLMEDYTFLSITQTATTVKVVSDNGRLLALYTSSDQSNSQGSTPGNSKSADAPSGAQSSPQSGSQGSTQGGTQGSPQDSTQGNSKPASGDGSKTTTTRMQGDQLVVVSTKDGVKTTRTYSPSADGAQLNLTTRVEGGKLKDPVTIRFVYDPPRAGDDDDSQ